MPESIAPLLTATAGIVGALAGAGVAWLRLGPERLKIQAEARKIDAEAERTDAEVDRELRADLRAAREATHSCEERERRLQRELQDVQGTCKVLQAQVNVLLRILPAGVLLDRLQQQSERLFRLFDVTTCCGIAITAPVDGGKFLFINHTLARALGREREALLQELGAGGYSCLVHPEDQRRTAETAAMAWGDNVTVWNRWRHADGSWIWLGWQASGYDPISLAFVEIGKAANDKGNAVS